MTNKGYLVNGMLVQESTGKSHTTQTVSVAETKVETKPDTDVKVETKPHVKGAEAK